MLSIKPPDEPTHKPPRLGTRRDGAFLRSLKADARTNMTNSRSDWTGNEVKALRERLGMSQGAFGELLGLPVYDGSCPRLSDIENDRRTASGPLCKLLDRIEKEEA